MSRSVFHTPKGWADKDETTLERMAKRPIGIIANALGFDEPARTLALRAAKEVAQSQGPRLGPLAFTRYTPGSGSAARGPRRR